MGKNYYNVSTATGICEGDKEKAELLHNCTGGFRTSKCGLWGFGFYSRMTADEIIDRLHTEHRNLCPGCWRRTSLRDYVGHDFTQGAKPAQSQEDKHAEETLHTLGMLATLKVLTGDDTPEVKEKKLEEIKEIMQTSKGEEWNAQTD